MNSQVLPQPTLQIQERGWVDAPPATWARFSGDPAMWSLVDDGVIQLSRPSSGRVRVHGTRFVGTATIAGGTLEIVEKVPGALAALLRFATDASFLVERQPAPGSELGPLIGLLVGQFLESVRAYAANGRDFRYVTEARAGPLVSGRIDIGRTIALRARGLQQLIAFDRQVLSHSTPKNRVVLAALRAIEQIGGIIPLPTADLASARTLSILFEDCLDSGIIYGTQEDLLAQAEQVQNSEPNVRDRDMLALATVLLAGESFEPLLRSGSLVPRTWFLNLETLFESAVRHVLRELTLPNLNVTNGAQESRPIFGSSQGEYTANPDLVLRGGGSVVAIGDVKYKQWSGAAAASDIYQLLVHAASFRSDLCFLVYPHDRHEAVWLGSSSTGCQTWLFAMDVLHLDVGLREALAAMDLG